MGRLLLQCPLPASREGSGAQGPFAGAARPGGSAAHVVTSVTELGRPPRAIYVPHARPIVHGKDHGEYAAGAYAERFTRPFPKQHRVLRFRNEKTSKNACLRAA